MQRIVAVVIMSLMLGGHLAYGQTQEPDQDSQVFASRYTGRGYGGYGGGYGGYGGYGYRGGRGHSDVGTLAAVAGTSCLLGGLGGWLAAKQTQPQPAYAPPNGVYQSSGYQQGGPCIVTTHERMEGGNVVKDSANRNCTWAEPAPPSPFSGR